MGSLIELCRQAIADRLWKRSSTFRRLLTSRHVWDLQAIFVVTLPATVGLLVWYVYGPKAPVLDEKFVGAVLLISGTILSWIYQNGSKRLGVVDLFACEIVTLCRVGTIAQLVPRLIDAHQRLSGCNAPEQPSIAPWQQIDFGHFSSQEDYFTAFEHNSKDLEILEADVVINVTAFYTYMKTLRDQMRRLGELGSGEVVKSQKAAVLITSIYMTFLAYESARKAIEELIEFEPTQAEAIVTGLVSELQAYRFLRDRFPEDDIRSRRLVLREPKYGRLVPPLYKKVMGAKDEDWENAQATAVDLKAVYNGLKFKPPIEPIDQPSISA